MRQSQTAIFTGHSRTVRDVSRWGLAQLKQHLVPLYVELAGRHLEILVDAFIALKNIEGVPTNLKKVEN